MSRKKADGNVEGSVVTAAQPIKATITGKETLEIPEEIVLPETDEQPTETEEKGEQEEEAVAEDTVYLGPNIRDININHGKVFAAGILPEFLQERIKEVPSIKGLIVPVSRYAEVARAVTLPDGSFSMLYRLTLNAVKDK